MTPVVVMAGGLGLRLHALTKDRPKPLLPVGNKTLLETIIDGFRDQGFRKIWLTVHYRAEMIEDYFGDGSKMGVQIRYIEEREPLGTAGGLKLLPKFDVPFIVSNADIIFMPPVQYNQMLEEHAKANALMTICGALHQHQVPFGVLDLESTGRISGIREKPIENFMVNAGVYVMDPQALEYMPAGAFDLPYLVERLPKTGPRSGTAVFAHQGQWQDLGHFEALARVHLMRTVGAL